MDSPSWTDAFQSAFSSCLHCFRAPSSDSDAESTHSRPRPPRYLESLLAEPQDTDTEAETVSLHSNIGDHNRRRQKKKNKQKTISFFGFDLFGKRATGPIHLPESEDEGDEEEIETLLGGTGRISGGRSKRRSLTLTFPDGSVADASPLDSTAIGERVIEEQELRAAMAREKEERRRKRKEKKEMKKLAKVLLDQNSANAGQFEGFQGSGDIPSSSYPHIPSPFQRAGFLPSPNSDEFGPFRRAQGSVQEDPDADADFDGLLYAAKKPSEGGSSASGGGSDSRRSPSGTSASRSDYSNPRSAENATPIPPSSQPLPKKKKSKKSSSSTAKSRSSASATSSEQTPSTPISEEMDPVVPAADGALDPALKPSMGFEGFSTRQGFNVVDDRRDFPSSGLGFGGAPRNNNLARSGAFLASRD